MIASFTVVDLEKHVYWGGSREVLGCYSRLNQEQIGWIHWWFCSILQSLLCVGILPVRPISLTGNFSFWQSKKLPIWTISFNPSPYGIILDCQALFQKWQATSKSYLNPFYLFWDADFFLVENDIFSCKQMPGENH